MKIALDRAVIRAFLRPGGGGQACEATAELLHLGATLCVLPIIAEEIEADGEETERHWREARLLEIKADAFLSGCAAGMARRYLDYHPDPRDCRLVAEAECAKMDTLVTLADSLISGLANRVENILMEKPWEAVVRYRHWRADD
jgi:hypothetical protein